MFQGQFAWPWRAPIVSPRGNNIQQRARDLINFPSWDKNTLQTEIIILEENLQTNEDREKQDQRAKAFGSTVPKMACLRPSRRQKNTCRESHCSRGVYKRYNVHFYTLESTASVHRNKHNWLQYLFAMWVRIGVNISSCVYFCFGLWINLRLMSINLGVDFFHHSCFWFNSSWLDLYPEAFASGVGPLIKNSACSIVFFFFFRAVSHLLILAS